MTKKLVLKLQVHDAKMKQKAMKAVSSIPGVESLAMDMKEQKLTIVGDVDPVQVVSKLRKYWHADILTVGPAKEPEKKDDKKDVKNDEKKDEKKECEQIAEMLKHYRAYNPHYTQHYRVYSYEEDPNSCTIC